MGMPYNIKAIRELTNEALTLEELKDLVFDDFRQVYEQFTEGQTKSQQIRILISYAEKRREIDKLLEGIKNINPKVYEEYESQLWKQVGSETISQPEGEDIKSINPKVYEEHEPQSETVPKPEGGGFFDRFSEKAIKVIMLAQEESRRLGHNFVGTETILLGLIGEGTGAAAQTLKSLGVHLSEARTEVEKIIGRGSGFVAAEIPFTSRTKRLLELAVKEADQLEDKEITTKHLLLGLIREGEGVAVRVLERMGVDLSQIRSEVITEPQEGLFVRFSEKAIKVIMLAQEESRRLGHNFVGTETILLGLIGEETGVAAQTLKSLGVNIKDARTEVEKIIGRGSGFVAAEIPFTPRAKMVLRLAVREAYHLGDKGIATEHLLLGLIRQGGGVAVRVLERMGVDIEKLVSCICSD